MNISFKTLNLLCMKIQTIKIGMTVKKIEKFQSAPWWLPCVAMVTLLYIFRCLFIFLNMFENPVNIELAFYQFLFYSDNG